MKSARNGPQMVQNHARNSHEYLGRDGVVVLVDQLVLVDGLRGQAAVGEDLDPLGLYDSARRES